jgi:O-antigen/teichoic acid export membrane protein
MSRRRNALIAAAFTYAQSILGILASFFITRLLVRALGADLYGTWLATGGLLGYAALADLGIFSVMPWLFAEADGEKDAARKRGLIAHGLLAGAGAGLFYAVAAFGVWLLLPRMAHLDVEDIERLRGPIIVIVVATTIGYPLRLFSALRSGLQDFKFMGILQVIGTVLNAALSYGLLRAGFGLYAVAIASVVPSTLTSICSLGRTFQRDRYLLRSLPKPTLRGTHPILASGTGNWMASLGWQMASATDAIVIAYLGYRHLVPSFVITSRLGLTLMQFAWSLPDSALIGLANLGAEGDRARTAKVVQALIRLNLIPAGVIACATLAANAAFVRLWVGSDLFGGVRLNALLTLDVVVLTVVHALVTPAAALGSKENRVQVGLITLANGVVHIVFALLLGHWFALSGVAAATALSALVTTIPVGARLLERTTGISAKSMLRSLILPWAARALPCALLATVAGWASTQSGFAPDGRVGMIVVAGGATAITVIAYLWGVKPLMKDLPFGPRLTRILSAVGLVPAADGTG